MYYDIFHVSSTSNIIDVQRLLYHTLIAGHCRGVAGRTGQILYPQTTVLFSMVHPQELTVTVLGAAFLQLGKHKYHIVLFIQ